MNYYGDCITLRNIVNYEYIQQINNHGEINILFSEKKKNLSRAETPGGGRNRPRHSIVL